MGDAESRIFELKVGIFITVGMLIFFIIVFSIGDVNLIRKGYHLEIVFNFANGVTASAPVRLAGVNIGQIEKVELFYDGGEERTKVRVTARISDADIKIERDAKAVINTLGLLGEKYMEIFPGTKRDDLLNDGDIIIGHDPISTSELTERAESLTESADIIITNLREGKGTLGKLLVEESVYNNIEAFTEDIRKHPWKLLHKQRKDRK